MHPHSTNRAKCVDNGKIALGGWLLQPMLPPRPTPVNAPDTLF